jgi:hypothetical protein
MRPTEGREGVNLFGRLGIMIPFHKRNLETGSRSQRLRVKSNCLVHIDCGTGLGWTDIEGFVRDAGRKIKPIIRSNSWCD